jgi:hypothetical protein
LAPPFLAGALFSYVSLNDLCEGDFGGCGVVNEKALRLLRLDSLDKAVRFGKPQMFLSVLCILRGARTPECCLQAAQPRVDGLV